MKTPRPVPTVDECPSWAKFIACDVNGKWYAYSHKPRIGYTQWVIDGYSDPHMTQFIRMANVDLYTWRQSLMPAPKKIEYCPTCEGTGIFGMPKRYCPACKRTFE